MSWATARQPHISHSSAALRCDLLRRSSPQIWRSSPQTTLAAYSQPALSHLDVVGHSKAALTLATAVQLWDDICCGGAALRYGEATLWYGEAAHRRHWPHTVCRTQPLALRQHLSHNWSLREHDIIVYVHLIKYIIEQWYTTYEQHAHGIPKTE